MNRLYSVLHVYNIRYIKTSIKPGPRCKLIKKTLFCFLSAIVIKEHQEIKRTSRGKDYKAGSCSY